MTKPTQYIISYKVNNGSCCEINAYSEEELFDSIIDLYKNNGRYLESHSDYAIAKDIQVYKLAIDNYLTNKALALKEKYEKIGREEYHSEQKELIERKYSMAVKLAKDLNMKLVPFDDCQDIGGNNVG